MGYAQKLFYPLGQGSSQLGRWRLPPDAFNEFSLPVPSRGEQATIVSFLDRETVKIDALVEEQRSLIALLKEKRQAVISHAVTKGLNPNTAMKDSGVEWLGEVPTHWHVVGLKHLCDKITDGAHISPETEGSVYPFISTKNIKDTGVDFSECLLTSQNNYDYLVRTGCKPSEGDVLFSKDGTIGRTAVVLTQKEFVVASSLIIITPSPEFLDSNYLHFLCQSDVLKKQIEALVKGAGLPRLSIKNLLRIVGIFPPIEEQRKISENLFFLQEEFNSIVAAVSAAISLLQERRSALISAAVTGKIDVRGSAQVLPSPFNRAHARGMIATEIVERSAHQATFGRVKLQKIAYLAEAHAGVSELKGVYLREAAGPLDREMIHDMEREASTLAGIRVEQPDGAGSAVAYRLGDQRGTHRQDLTALLGDRAAKFDKLIDDMGTIDTKGAEAVATLYAVWNDALIDGEMPSDMEIKLTLLSEWHPEKARKFRIDELQIWLDWMRRHGLVPTGAGSKTSTGRLFA